MIFFNSSDEDLSIGSGKNIENDAQPSLQPTVRELEIILKTLSLELYIPAFIEQVFMLLLDYCSELLFK